MPDGAGRPGRSTAGRQGRGPSHAPLRSTSISGGLRPGSRATRTTRAGPPPAVMSRPPDPWRPDPTTHGRAPPGAAAARRPAARRPPRPRDRCLGRLLRPVHRQARVRLVRRRSSASGACPYSTAGRAQRSRHAGSIAAGTSRCAPASQTRLHDPRHDAIGVVAAAAGREPPAAGVPMRDRVDQPRGLAHRGRRHAQVRERIPGVRVGAVLADDQVRPERRGELGDQQLGRRRATPPRRSRAPSGRSPPSRGGPLAESRRGSRSREQVVAGLVERDGQDARVVPVDRPGRRRRGGRRSRGTGRGARRAGPGRSRGPGRRRCRTRTPGRASRGGGRRPGGTRARRRRAGSPRSPGASHRRPWRPRRACPRTAGRHHPVRSRPPAGAAAAADSRLTVCEVGARRGTTASSSSGAGSGARPGSAPTVRSRSIAGPEPPRRQRMRRAEVVGRRARTVDEQHAWHDTRDGTGLHHAPPRQARGPAGDARRAHRHRRRDDPPAPRRIGPPT